MTRTDYEREATEIIRLATAQVRAAQELGKQAARIGVSAEENPFKRLIGHDSLSRAWATGHRDTLAFEENRTTPAMR